MYNFNSWCDVIVYIIEILYVVVFTLIPYVSVYYLNTVPVPLK